MKYKNIRYDFKRNQYEKWYPELITRDNDGWSDVHESQVPQDYIEYINGLLSRKSGISWVAGQKSEADKTTNNRPNFTFKELIQACRADDDSLYIHLFKKDIKNPFTIKVLNTILFNLKREFKKIGDDEVYSIFLNTLHAYIYNEKNKYPIEGKESKQLINHFSILAKNAIRRELEKKFSKIVSRNEQTGEFTTEVSILYEYSDTSEDPYTGEESETEVSVFDGPSVDNWRRPERHTKDFNYYLQHINFEANYLTEVQRKAYPLILQYATTVDEGKDKITYKEIGEHLNCTEQRAKEIATQIGRTLKKVHELWEQMYHNQNIPMSVQIKDFQILFNELPLNDVDLRFNFLITWLKRVMEKSKTNHGALEIINNLMDQGMDGNRQYIFIDKLGKTLNGTLWETTLALIDESAETKNVSKQDKKKILKSILRILDNYLDDFQVAVFRIEKYNQTYNRNLQISVKN